MQNGSPSRAIVNFTQRCAMKCEWCYVPFASKAVDKDVVIRIVERLKELSFDCITFGGGDPFQYKFIGQILRRARELGLFVHVDSHAIALNCNSYNANLLERFVDIIGLPLDGSNPSVHNAMRSSKGHYEQIDEKLDWIKSLDVDLKINTIISSVNLNDLSHLSEKIYKIQPSRWSIYQYWPVGVAEKVKSKHNLNEACFKAHIKNIGINNWEGETIVEINSAESRRSTYPIIHHNGEVNVHANYPTNQFEVLGSIFQNDIKSQIIRSCGGERRQAVSRYR